MSEAVITSGVGRSATLADAMRSEWTKVRTLRSTVWAVLATVVLGVGFGALLSLAGARRYTEMTTAERLGFDPAATSLAGHLVAQLAIGVLGVLVITAEYATGMLQTSLAVVPRRGRLLAAKAVVFTVVALVVGEIVGFGAFFTGQYVLTGQEAPHTALSQDHVLRAVAGTGLYLAVVGLLGVAVGTLVRATAGALAIIVTVTLLVPAFVPALPGSWARVVGKFWPTMAGNRIMTVVHDPHVLAPWAGFGLLCAVVAVVFAAAVAVFRTRDV
ncbi:ABC transporter permease [Actinomadura sp. HBU206391]|uniref:ABC transporter permease n=1 Tax=Actinomadura sp. HBU206391 TaxID=2731692 RepID=UPI00164F4721|nr:ABC transporter permease [Actinomadura sp. HBU206391]MBC6460171.1 ABC transporter permease [Actinomadura sp. HBU206391]